MDPQILREFRAIRPIVIDKLAPPTVELHDSVAKIFSVLLAFIRVVVRSTQ